MATIDLIKAAFRAAEEGDAEGLATMLDGTSQLLLSTMWGRKTLLTLAAARNQVCVLRLLLERGAPIDATNDDGRTALQCAVIHGHEDVVAHLLDAGADPTKRDLSTCTVLIRAAEYGHLAVVKLLLRHVDRCGVNVRTEQGQTALWWACRFGHVEVVQALLLAGADHTIASKFPLTPREIARKSKQQQCVAAIEVRAMWALHT
jgi:ankyrin repeat protein